MKNMRVEVADDLVMEILSKLPVKSLTRFKCVCKYWCSSFQTPHFISKHHRNNLINNHLNLLLLRCHGNTTDDISYLSQLSTHKHELFSVKQNIRFPCLQNAINPPPQVYGPCDGILCLRDLQEGKIALWNPSTREFKLLPPSSLQQPPSPRSVVFDCVGFGFDSKTDDFKVILFATYYYVYPDLKSQVELYSLNSNSWKDCAVPKHWPIGHHYFEAYIDGIIYWVAEVEKRRCDHAVILSFDMANERFSTLPFPADYGRSFLHYCFELLEFNGSLGVIVYPYEGTDKPFDIWVMNGGVWTKQLSIESVSEIECPLGFWMNGEWFLGGSNDELLLFDPSTRELKKLGINGQSYKMKLITYVESLVSINGRSENDERIVRQPI